MWYFDWTLYLSLGILYLVGILIPTAPRQDGELMLIGVWKTIAAANLQLRFALYETQHSILCLLIIHLLHWTLTNHIQRAASTIQGQQALAMKGEGNPLEEMMSPSSGPIKSFWGQRNWLCIIFEFHVKLV